MAKKPPRDNNVDMTRSTMQRRINELVKKCTTFQESLTRKNKKLSKFNSLTCYLVAKDKMKREDIKKFLKGEM